MMQIYRGLSPRC